MFLKIQVASHGAYIVSKLGTPKQTRTRVNLISVLLTKNHFVVFGGREDERNGSQQCLYIKPDSKTLVLSTVTRPSGSFSSQRPKFKDQNRKTVLL